MKIRGKIIEKFFSGAETVDFYIDEVLCAKLALGREERKKDNYRLIFQDSDNKVFPITTIKSKGVFSKSYLIEAMGQSTPWIYKCEKWYDSLLGKRVLLTADDKFEIAESNNKIEVFKNDRRIGTARKVYESIFDKGEYYISFELGHDIRLPLVIASILIIDTEVMNKRGD